jgi:hypothetical protein
MQRGSSMDSIGAHQHDELFQHNPHGSAVHDCRWGSRETVLQWGRELHSYQIVHTPRETKEEYTYTCVHAPNNSRTTQLNTQ